MKVPIQKLIALRNIYNINFNLSCLYFENFLVKGKKFFASDDVTISDLEYMQNFDVEHVEVMFSEKFYNILSNEFPLEYRKPFGFMDFMEMDRHLELLDKVNTLTKRKRFLYVVGDIIGVDPNASKRIILASHNDVLDYKKWNIMKRYVVKDQKFFYRNSETGIMLFVDLTPDSERAFVERFRKNTDLVTAIVSTKKDFEVEIAPDFIPIEDVISVNDPGKLFETYKTSNSRLIIIGENISDSYKQALLDVKQYDKYVRMMLVPSIDLRDLTHFLLQVKLVYNSDRWTI
jgi:hypothetical protein